MSATTDWVIRNQMLIEVLRKLHERVVQTADFAIDNRKHGRESGADFSEGQAEAFKEAFDIVRRGT
jgi:hypothetical protein